DKSETLRGPPSHFSWAAATNHRCNQARTGPGKEGSPRLPPPPSTWRAQFRQHFAGDPAIAAQTRHESAMTAKACWRDAQMGEPRQAHQILRRNHRIVAGCDDPARCTQRFERTVNQGVTPEKTPQVREFAVMTHQVVGHRGECPVAKELIEVVNLWPGELLLQERARPLPDEVPAID